MAWTPEGATLVEDKKGYVPEGATLISDANEPDDTPVIAGQRAKEAMSIATEHKLGVDVGQKLVAGPEPSAFGKYMGQVKSYITEKTGLFSPDISPIDRKNYREEQPLSSVLAGAGIYYGAGTVSGLTGTALDVLTNKTVGDKRFADFALRVSGIESFQPTEREQQGMETVETLAAFAPIAKGVSVGMKAIPAAQALKTMLGAGLTFGSTEAAIEFSRNVTDGIPVDWKEIHLQSAVGVLFGTGEVAVSAAMSGLAKGIEKYWGERGIELASKIKPVGMSQEAQVARQEAEIRSDIQRYKDTFTGEMTPEKQAFREQMREKYVTGKPQQGSALVEEKPPTPAVEARATEKATIAPKEQAVAPQGDKVPATVTGGAAGMRSGSTPLFNDIIDEAVVNTKLAVETAQMAGKNIPKVAEFYMGRAAETIASHYGETGSAIAKDVKEISFKSANRASKQDKDIENILKGVTYQERIELGKIGQKRVEPPNERLKKIHEQLLEVMDRDMVDADKAGYRRSVGGQWRNLTGTGGYVPQVLNKRGVLRMRELQHEGLANPNIKAVAEKMVAEGTAKDADEALGKLLDWNNQRIRGTHGYFERTRTLLPEDWVELDVGKTLSPTIHKNADMIAAAEVWGVEGDGLSVDFTRARELIGKVGEKYGMAESNALQKWVKTSFGLSNDIPAKVSELVNAVSRYETMSKLGFRASSALRNLTQGDVNLFTAPLSVHLKGNAAVIFKKWNTEYQKLYDEASRSGAVFGQKEISEIENAAEGESKTQKASMYLFGTAEESNQIRAAIIARLSADKMVQDYIALRSGSKLSKIATHFKYLSVNPESYIYDRIKNKTFTNPITDEQVQAILSGEKIMNLGDYERIMHRASVDTQFVQNFATRPIPWKTNPWLRLGAKFKTFTINQTRLVWEDAVKQALKGTFAPLARYMLWATLAGEAWNLSKDFIGGGDNSLASTIVKRPEKRNAKDIAYLLANDFIDGGGIGILTDVSYGVGNFIAGPIGSTGKNALVWASELRHPFDATKKLIKKEVAISRDADTLMARADKLFINKNNPFFEIKRWRSRAFEWQAKQQRDTILEKVGGTAKDILLGKAEFRPNLLYQSAADQIAMGDIDDAASYIAEHIGSAKDWSERAKAEKGIKISLDSHGPLGPISEENKWKFLSQFSKQEQDEAIKLDYQWKNASMEAIWKAEKQIN